ncbi:hypothetical protein ATANTOWER_006427 [Ataeniobius toweri]|uniref:Uncharacterized protein n=1 Tax=Ataeniobius toweri TaxID=208326 RepID=A0ABU7CFH6_9TELE|nr:hypothetical protein [Ataeniobius toweri]
MWSLKLPAPAKKRVKDFHLTTVKEEGSKVKVSLTESDKQDRAAAAGSLKKICPSESSQRFPDKQTQIQRETNHPQVTTFNSAHLHTIFFCSTNEIHRSTEGSQNITTTRDITDDDLSITAAICLLVTLSNGGGGNKKTQTDSQQRPKVPEQLLIQSRGPYELIFSDTNTPFLGMKDQMQIHKKHKPGPDSDASSLRRCAEAAG